MRFRGLTLFCGPVLLAALAAPLATGCEKVQEAAEDGPLGDVAEICGPCGSVLTGDVGISGEAKLDGFFKAVADLNGAVATLSGNFEAHLAELEAAFGVEVDANATLQARVDGVVAAIEAELTANVSGSLMINYVPPRCSANVSVAIEAQAQCEAKAGCTGEVDPGSVSVECEGTCEGSCEGTCEGTAQCKVDAPSVQCEGTCEGTCTLEAGGECNGTCRGTCDGTCSARANTDNDGDGELDCAGTCDGTCTGNCELSVGASCSGTCTGSCTADPGGAECTGELKCEGSCQGSCSGGCTGSATPPSAHVDCEASAECNAQASAQASANVECTPPSIDIGFEFNADAQADMNMQAAFGAKMAALKVHGAAMLQSFTQYQALLTGEVNGEVVFDPSPVDQIRAQLQVVIDAGVEGDLIVDLPIGRLPCVIPALMEAGQVLVDLTTETGATLSAQASFATAFSGGFGG